jgi:hypothetical protein
MERERGDKTMTDPTSEPRDERIDFEQFVETSLRAVTRALEARGIEGRPAGPEDIARIRPGKTGIIVGIIIEPRPDLE